MLLRLISKRASPFLLRPSAFRFASNASSISPDGQTDAQTTKRQFQAETKKLLQIVANSLYSDKEVFCRELISNAADAIEKLRYVASSTSTAQLSPPEIRITVDPKSKTFSIQDSGIGMTEDELVDYLGTIAKSGSKSFVETMDKDEKSIIGQFGVGFYSSYMVGDNVTVYTKSANTSEGGYKWESDGLGGTFTITKDNTITDHGTRIVIHLRDDCLDFADSANIENIVKKYSNFVGIPIILNGKSVNTIEPLWSKEPQSVSDEQHKKFYRFIANAWDDYKYKLHFKADAPVHINALLYIPSRNTEVFGMGMMEPGVNLYCRKVLLQGKSKQLLPEYFRFLRGVVESDDLPMNLSREMLQNSPMISKLSEIVTNKVIKWLQTEAKRDNVKYSSFYNDFGRFIKEGVCLSDGNRQKEMAKLLRFENLNFPEPCSLDDYISNAKEEQKHILYLVSPNKTWANESPYVEPFKNKGYNVLVLTNSDDEFVVDRLSEYNGMKLESVDSTEARKLVEDETCESEATTLSAEDITNVQEWFKTTLEKSVSMVSFSKKSFSYPAVITDHESPTIRRMMKMMPKSSPTFLEEAPHKLELNPKHPIIIGLSKLIKTDQDLAKDVTRQVFDNALIAAGLMDDPRVMLKRINRILEKSTK